MQQNKNPKTELNPFLGVDRVQFASEIEQQWIRYGNEPSGNLKQNWRKLAYTLNQHLQNAGTMSKMMVYRFPLPTGGGKSTSIPYYFALLGAMAGTRDRCPGAIITTQYVSECDRIASEINRLGAEFGKTGGSFGMQEPMATPLHSGVNRKGLNLPSWPFVVTTQAGMTRALVEENNDELKGKFRALPWLLQYDNGAAAREDLIHSMVNHKVSLSALTRIGLDGNRRPQRHMVVFDEMLMPLKSHVLTDEGIRLLLKTIPKELAAKHRESIQTISEMIGLIALNSCMNFEKAQLAEADLGDWKERCASVVPLYRDFRDRYSGKGKLPVNSQFSYSEIMDTLTAIYNIKECGGTAALRSNGSIQSLFKADWLMDRLKMGFVCLDATAKESKLLDACEEHTTVRLKPCRDYQNLTIEVDTTISGTGRGALAGSWKHDDEKKEVLNATVDRIVDILQTEINPERYPKVGLISFKPIIEALQRKGMTLPYELILGYHGNVIGRNDWNDVDLLYIIGLNHMVPTYGDEMKLGIDDHIQGLEEMQKWTPCVAVPDFKWSAGELQSYDLLRDLVQVISRGSNRRTIDGEGNCRLSTVRVTLGTSEKIHLIGGLKRNFRNARIKQNTWTLYPKKEQDFDFKNAQSLLQRAEALKFKANSLGRNRYEVALHWFNLTGKTDVSLTKVCTVFKWSGYRSRLKTAFTNDKYQSLMDELGIRFSYSVHSIRHPRGVDGLVKV